MKTISTFDLKCLAFDGENEITVTRAQVRAMSPTQLVGLLQSTAVYRDIINDFIEFGMDSVVSIQGRKPSPTMALQVERGFRVIYDRVEEVFGEDAAAEIWANIINTINLEKCE